MGVTEDMDMAASADQPLLKHLQLHITDMGDTEDMVDTDMAVNDDLLSPIMDMDMDVKLILSNFEGKRFYPFCKSHQMKKLPARPIILSSQNKNKLTKRRLLICLSKNKKEDKI